MAKSIKSPSTSKVTIRTELCAELNALCDAFMGVMAESQSLSAELGTITREAAKHVTEETLPAFIGGCAELCEAAGLTGGSVKVYLSNMRGVLRAMLAGWVPDAGIETLRAMYDAIPDAHRGQGANKGGGKRAARVPGTTVAIGADGKAVDTATGKPAETAGDARRAAITALFGFYTPELADAIEYAKDHAGIFQTWAKASAKAAQTVQPLKRAA